MKNGLNSGIVLLVVIAGIVIGLKMNDTSASSFFSAEDTESTSTTEKKVEKVDPLEPLRSDEKHVKQEKVIKNAFDEYMNLNFYKYYKTSWWDSVSAGGAVINKYGRTFILQSSSDVYNSKTQNYLIAASAYFNDKTLESEYQVDRLVLVDSKFSIMDERKIIKW